MIRNKTALDRHFTTAVTLLHPKMNGHPVSQEELVRYFKRDIIALLERPESWQGAMIYEWLKTHNFDLTG